MTERSAIHATFVIERTYDAPPAARVRRVRRPRGQESLVRRTATAGGPTSYQLDFRVGGSEHYRGQPRRQESHLRARYYDIVADERMVWAYDMHMDGNRISVSLATIELRPEGTGTRLVLTEHDTFLDGHEQPGPREEGTKDLLDSLASRARDPRQ